MRIPVIPALGAAERGIRLGKALAVASVMTAVALAAAACADTSNPVQPVGPQFAGSFVGYVDVTGQQTTCGNCHPGKQRDWLQTGHAKAWSALGDSGRANASCQKCHTTNGLTNAAADSDGYFRAGAAARRRFQDVQCESCHGPGQAHVTLPDSTKPIPYLTAGDSGLTHGCGACHSGAQQPFFEDWSSGGHGVLEAPAIASGGACLGCHEAKAVNSRFGGSNLYAEANDPNPMPITCVSCHDPHGNSANVSQLRFSMAARDTTNLCIQCHNRRAVPDLTTARGPHAPQGPTFLGYAGWQPPGFSWDSTNIPSHANPGPNPDLCGRCHVATFSVGSGASFVRNYTGHKFYAIPCLAADGTVDTTTTCDPSVRTFATCADNDGCHSSEGAARALFVSLDQEMRYLADVLWHDTNGNDVIDAGDTGLLTQVPSSEFTVSATMTTAKGALFNVRLLNTDRSHGVHNPPYLRSLLIATINAVQTTYGLSVPPAVQARLAAASRSARR